MLNYSRDAPYTVGTGTVSGWPDHCCLLRLLLPEPVKINRLRKYCTIYTGTVD